MDSPKELAAFKYGSQISDLNLDIMRLEMANMNNDLARILSSLNDLTHKVNLIMATLDDVQTAVTAEDTVIDSAVALLNGLAGQIAALQPNQQAIDALAADVRAKTQTLADAITANTPGTPTPSPAVTPTP